MTITGPETVQPLPRELVDICELNSLSVVGLSSPIPAIVGAEVDDTLLRVRVAGELPDYVTVKLSGLRAGQAALRFPRYSEEQMHRNNAFWRQAYE